MQGFRRSGGQGLRDDADSFPANGPGAGRRVGRSAFASGRVLPPPAGVFGVQRASFAADDAARRPESDGCRQRPRYNCESATSPACGSLLRLAPGYGAVGNVADGLRTRRGVWPGTARDRTGVGMAVRRAAPSTSLRRLCRARAKSASRARSTRRRVQSLALHRPAQSLRGATQGARDRTRTRHRIRTRPSGRCHSRPSQGAAK
jgi:hypothetical protein